jgi:hypothetical protein
LWLEGGLLIKYYYRPTTTVSDLGLDSFWLILVGLEDDQWSRDYFCCIKMNSIIGFSLFPAENNKPCRHNGDMPTSETGPFQTQGLSV